MQDEIFDELLVEFLEEAVERVDSLERALLEIERETEVDRHAELLARAKRELHTLKGNSGVMGLQELQELAHAMEEKLAESNGEGTNPAIVRSVLEYADRFRSCLTPLRSDPATHESLLGAEAPQQATTIRVQATAIDHLVEQTAELMNLRNRLMKVIGEWRRVSSVRGANGDAHQVSDDGLSVAEALERALGRIREDIIRLRMQPLAPVLQSLRRLVRDEAGRSGKRVELSIRGENTPLDRSLSRVAADTLGHLVRNAVVHGLERPDRRAEAGKQETGTVLVEASVVGDRVVIDVVDDGCGIDEDALRTAANRAGVEGASAMDLHSLVFRAGLSSRAEVDIDAGRGIGTSAVLEAVHQAGGSIELQTRRGLGTHFRLHLPLRVAVSHVLLVSVDGVTYGLPSSSILETVALDSSVVATPNAIEWRGREATLVDLGELLGHRSLRARSFAAVVEVEGRLCAIAIDRLGELEELVVRPLDPVLCAPAGVSGSSILGNGSVVLVLEPAEITIRSAELRRSA